MSVLFGVGDPQLRRQVTEANDRAVDAVLGWLESQAHTRMRRRGLGFPPRFVEGCLLMVEASRGWGGDPVQAA